MATLQERIAAIPYWYHKIDFGNGVVTPGWAPLDPSAYCVPDRLDGELVLDVGCWDGYWTFDALKRGAKFVSAMEDFSDTCGGDTNADRSKQWETFDLCADALGLMEFDKYVKWNCSIENHRSFPPEFDRVFMFGVLYHLKNPMRAISNCFDSMKPGGTIHVETAILDNLSSPYTNRPHDPDGCYAEFYAEDEFGMNKSNWWVPTLKCAAAWLQAAGFVEVETWKLTDSPTNLSECRGFLKAKKPT